MSRVQLGWDFGTPVSIWEQQVKKKLAACPPPFTSRTEMATKKVNQDDYALVGYSNNSITTG